MQEKEIREILEQFNVYLRNHLWMDFELVEYSKTKLRIIGSIDISDKPNIELIFRDVFFVSTPFNWKTDTGKEVGVLLSGEEAKKVNLKYQVEQGYHIIKIQPEDYPEEFGCLFGVKGVDFNIL